MTTETTITEKIIYDTSGTVEDRINRLVEHARNLERDRARLDWMDNFGYELELPKSWSIELPNNQTSSTRDIRAAIDAAMPNG
jgi:hypothetical protein